VGFYAPGKEGLKRAGWLCHLGGRPLAFLADAGAAQAWLAAAPGRVIVTDPEVAAPVPGSKLLQSWRVGDQPWNAIVADAAMAAPQP